MDYKLGKVLEPVSCLESLQSLIIPNYCASLASNYWKNYLNSKVNSHASAVPYDSKIPISQIVPVVTQIFPTKMIPFHIKAPFIPRKKSIFGPLPVSRILKFSFPVFTDTIKRRKIEFHGQSLGKVSDMNWSSAVKAILVPIGN